ncbi:hypothetical protein, partial [Micromonospora schwarzwaldensis]
MNEFLVVAVDYHPHAVPQKRVLDIVHFAFERQQTFTAGDCHPFDKHGDQLLFGQKLLLLEYQFDQFREFFEVGHGKSHKEGSGRADDNNQEGRGIHQRRYRG